MRAKQKRETQNGPALLPPRDEAFDEPLLVGSVRGRVTHDEDDRPRRLEAEAADHSLVLRTRSLAVEDVRLRPTGDHDAVVVDPVVTDEVGPHHVVLHDVTAEG